VPLVHLVPARRSEGSLEDKVDWQWVKQFSEGRMGNLVASVHRGAAKLTVRPQLLNVHDVQDQRRNILFVTPELTDLVKVGGLGDVSSSLPRALNRQHDVRLLIPGYREVLSSPNPVRILGSLEGNAALPPCRLGCMELSDGLTVYVLICPDLYEREGYPYGDARGRDWPDNHIRFGRLGLAAAQIAAGKAGTNWLPQLVHANDWPTALAPAYMAWMKLKTPSIFTIHNLTYQGLCDAACMPELGVPGDAFTPEGIEFHGRLSFMKAGIVYASHLTTVSQTYAREITTQAAGCGLDGILRLKAERGLLTGITNGIDQNWNPEIDPNLLEGCRDLQGEGKRAHRRYIEERFELEPGEGPLFVVVSRLVHQKGIDLTAEVAGRIVAAGGRIAAIGRGEAHLEAAMAALPERHPGRIGVQVGFNELDARRMFAGSDFLLMPSRFEPCGLSQMYAQRYGSLPIARRTGGLADTIEDGVTGFLFDDATPESYLDAVHRALAAHKDPEALRTMRQRAMAAPQYWNESVRPYDQLYEQLTREPSPHSATPETGRRT
jgi:starch synthase